MTHKHVFKELHPNASVAVCRCGAFRHTAAGLAKSQAIVEEPGPLPLEHAAEYDAAAQWMAREGLKGNQGDPLPPNMATDGALRWIQADIEAFQSRVREFAYALAMDGKAPVGR